MDFLRQLFGGGKRNPKKTVKRSGKAIKGPKKTTKGSKKTLQKRKPVIKKKLTKKNRKSMKDIKIKAGGPLTPGRPIKHRRNPKGPKGANLYMRNIPYEATTRQIERIFLNAGFRPIGVNLPGNKYMPEKGAGIGFVSFATREEAGRVLDRFQYGIPLGKRVIRISLARNQ